MEKVNEILKNPVFLREVKKLEILEADREFCRHGIEHLLAVARIAWIRAMEEHFPVSKETVYAGALLHDIGRAAQYETGEPHDIAGVRIAGEILKEVSFPEEETEEILRAIAGHRISGGMRDMSPLSELLYRADKKSRDCFLCPAEKRCNWPEEKKNRAIER